MASRCHGGVVRIRHAYKPPAVAGKGVGRSILRSLLRSIPGTVVVYITERFGGSPFFVIFLCAVGECFLLCMFTDTIGARTQRARSLHLRECAYGPKRRFLYSHPIFEDGTLHIQKSGALPSHSLITVRQPLSSSSYLKPQLVLAPFGEAKRVFCHTQYPKIHFGSRA